MRSKALGLPNAWLLLSMERHHITPCLSLSSSICADSLRVLFIECAFNEAMAISRLFSSRLHQNHQLSESANCKKLAALLNFVELCSKKNGGGVNSAPALSFGFPMKLVRQLEEYSNHSSVTRNAARMNVKDVSWSKKAHLCCAIN